MGTAIALGNFDGVHKAHEALMRRMLEVAEEKGYKSIVYFLTPIRAFFLRRRPVLHS